MKIIIIDKVHNYLSKSLIENGFQVDDFQNISATEVERKLPEYEGIIIRSKIFLGNKILSQLPNLKFIARVGAGMESIDVQSAKNQGIILINSPEGNRDSVAEHALGMILNLLNKISISNQQVKKGFWQREINRGFELMGKTVGIIGYGNMGSAFAQRLTGFGVKVISYDKYKKYYSDKFTKEVTLDEIFELTDILSIHVPLQNDTFYMVDNEFINKFKKNIYFINTARGKVTKTSDLVENLKNGKILGACLDVLEYEKISFENLSDEKNSDIIFLQNAENVILTPHIAGLTFESDFKLAKVTFDKILHFFKP